MNRMTRRLAHGRFSDGPLSTLDVVCFAVLLLAGSTLYATDRSTISYILLVFAAITAIGSPPAAVGSIVVAIPLVQRPVQIGDSSWKLLEIAILLATMSIAVRLAWAVVQGRSVRPVIRLFRPYLLSVLALALIFIGGVSLFTVADDRYRPDSIRELRWVVVEPIAAFVVFRWAIQRGCRWHIVAVFIATGVAVAVEGVVQLALGNGVVIADGVERATGPYLHPNNLALYLERVSVVCLALAIALRGPRRLLLLAFAATMCGLIATLSRGAAIALVAGAIWIVVALQLRYGWRWIAAGVLAGSIVIGIVAADRVIDSGGSGTRSSRELIWVSSVELIRDYPVTGVGLDQFLNQYGRRYIEPAGWPERYTSHPHNLILDFWLRLGILGLAWLSVFAATCVLLARRVRSMGRAAPMALAALAALIAGAVHGMVDNGFFLPDLAVASWLMVALAEPAAFTSTNDASLE